MPEGDTIHKLATFLGPRLVGRTIAAGVVRTAPVQSLAGRRVEAVRALGKHLLIALDDGTLLRSHLGMWGAWHRYGPDERWRRPACEAAIELRIDDAVYVCFKPKEVERLRDHGLRHRQLAVRLGPDLIAGEADYATIVRRAREILTPAKPLVDLLLDQRVAAGIGNVYKCEVLFLERRHPLSTLGGLDDAALTSLYRRARALLRDNLGGGPRVTRRSDDDASGLWVYRRRGRPCHVCATAIDYARLGADHRATYWCPRCQAG
ncbi:formamidopyrimidine-DNA glycosylase [Thioflavicoccus mobilis 8321]|uniref:DNA-(apurinic or apyrimidinic site) lyase n=1 Tax=Thioflavicoccus mobilis 8321 TaxID=765912 RepID=L0GWL5_9GAMM|nr:DNA-formamidopyrimidine glycosylase family protein [Thioflavicoccus mobilis]AGA90371.1 formamidopyrimidine-DNA glycosylase [Thioflavicoccus mobilis 8321]